MMYDVGDVVRITVSFTDIDGEVADPTDVSVSYRVPRGTITTLAYGTDAEVVKDSSGVYYVDVAVPAAASGSKLQYRWVGTGAIVAAVEGEITVRMSAF
jgi:hypothetical protein